jgi:hypothetical protein
MGIPQGGAAARQARPYGADLQLADLGDFLIRLFVQLEQDHHVAVMRCQQGQRAPQMLGRFVIEHPGQRTRRRVGRFRAVIRIVLTRRGLHPAPVLARMAQHEVAGHAVQEIGEHALQRIEAITVVQQAHEDVLHNVCRHVRRAAVQKREAVQAAAVAPVQALECGLVALSDRAQQLDVFGFVHVGFVRSFLLFERDGRKVPEYLLEI